MIHTVTTLKYYTFQNCINLQQVTLPVGLKEIQSYAFYGCKNLALETLPAEVTKIGTYAFEGCYSLALKELPAGVTEIGHRAFYGCGSLALKKLPAGLKMIDNATFYGCSSLALEELPAEVTEINIGAFMDCTSLALKELPAGLGRIGNSAFEGCNSLALEKLPDKVTEIEYNAFEGCSSLALKELPAGLKRIGTGAFKGCSSLALEKLPDGVTEIGEYTFEGCSSLALKKLPDGVTEIGHRAFADCSSLALKELPAGLERIGTATFYGCSGIVSLTLVSNWASTLGPNAFGNVSILFVPKNGIGYDGENWPTARVVFGASLSALEVAGGILEPDFFPNRYSYTVRVPVDREQITISPTTYGTATVSINGAAPAQGKVSVNIPLEMGETVEIKMEVESNDLDKNTYTIMATRETAPVTGSTLDRTEISLTTGSASSATVYEPRSSYVTAGDRIWQSVSRSDLKQLADTGKSLSLSCDRAGMIFAPGALRALLAASPAGAGSLTFGAVPAEAAKTTGSRPVYDFTVSHKDGTGNQVEIKADFPRGSVSIWLDYVPAATERPGALFLVYLKEKSSPQWLNKSCSTDGRVHAEVLHFSRYGVGYRSQTRVFTDTGKHWAQDAIDFAVARNLLSPMEGSRFSPDEALTRGMLVTALGRLAGVNPESYKTTEFTDIGLGDVCGPYAQWAAEKGILKGTGEKLFSPEAPVTREQMAAAVAGYAKETGYALPVRLETAAYGDGRAVSSWAAPAVSSLQRAGILMGKDGNRFAPQENATRGQMAALLYRMVGVLSGRTTTEGFVRNDSGSWLCYRKGKLLTGWQTVEGKRCYFGSDGVMAEDTAADT